MPTVAVIGSGYGGATAAEYLAKRGTNVHLFEAGQDWRGQTNVHPAMTSPDKNSMWFETHTDMPFSNYFGLPVVNRPVPRYAGILGLNRFAHMKVYLGKGLGGGSLVNGGMAVTPARSFFSSVLPNVSATEMYSKYFPAAHQALGSHEPPSDLVATSAWYQFARVAAGHSIAVGDKIAKVPNVYDWDYLRQEIVKRVPRSALAKELMYGNRHGKKDLTKTIIRRAFATGKVSLTPLTEVTAIAKHPDTGVFTLTFKQINTSGATVRTWTQTYDSVVLACGSVGSTKLLMQARHSGSIPGLSGNNALGKHWGPNGNTMMARALGIGTATGAHQSVIPAVGVNAWDDGPGSVFAEIAPLPTGLETNTANYLAITNNPNEGTFSINARGELALDWDSAKSAPSVAAAKAFLDRLNARWGSRTRTDLFLDGKGFADYFSYHPLGGAVIGKAVAETGEVNGAPGLFVLDGALIPAKIGVNPFVTIVALVMRCLDKAAAAGRI